MSLVLSPCSAQAPGDGDEQCTEDEDAPTYPDNEKTQLSVLAATQNNWLFTHHIRRDFDSSSHNYTVNIIVGVIYALQSCRSRLGCDMGFRFLTTR